MGCTTSTPDTSVDFDKSLDEFQRDIALSNELRLITHNLAEHNYRETGADPIAELERLKNRKLELEVHFKNRKLELERKMNM